MPARKRERQVRPETIDADMRNCVDLTRSLTMAKLASGRTVLAGIEEALAAVYRTLKEYTSNVYRVLFH
jgi:hypothetical protein